MNALPVWIQTAGALVALGATLSPSTGAECQIQKLSDPAWDVIQLGMSVAASSTALAVGVPADFDAPSLMAAYVFVRTPNRWGRDAVLHGDGASPGDFFGRSVGLDGNTLAVGASWTLNEPAIEGAVYVFEQSAGGAWHEVAHLLGNPVDSDPSFLELFGDAVALDDARLLVGAPNEPRGGSAYVFERAVAGAWSQSAKLLASDGTGGDAFGTSLAIHDDIIVVGAPEDDPLGFSSGSAYVFEMDSAGDWVERAKLIPSDHGFLDSFGDSLATDARTILVGAFHASDGDTAPGAVYVFEPDAAGPWREIQKLTPPDGQNSDYFGVSVAMDGELAVVGAENYELDGTNVGAVFVYRRGPDRLWRLVNLIRADDPEREAEFGRSVALSGNLAVVGAPFKDGVDANGDPLPDAGAAYVFAVGPDRDENGVMDVCDCRGAIGGGKGAGFVGNPDLNLDRVVDLADVMILLSNYGHTRDNPPADLPTLFAALHEYGDLDLDQDIDLQDLALMLAAYGRACGD